MRFQCTSPFNLTIFYFPVPPPPEYPFNKIPFAIRSRGKPGYSVDRSTTALSAIGAMSPQVFSNPPLLMVKQLSGCLVLLLVAFSCVRAAASSQSTSLDVPSRSLSRHRRFVVPKGDGWEFRFNIRFRLQIPLSGPANSGANVVFQAPFQFTYNLDQGPDSITTKN